ncbi:hypothetical protein HH308_26855 [Gordonia sp. TBRC 11910]|uniref:Uncharacterized protein n=1 Tax=Gordonia asplenii TaxID=2725283 RepID=A0A848L1G4_9ACTN|nr:hypothetical protein [Gordonia asplenii]NMO04850.1 hypothetical protein [Gordonia asplenii]
MLHFSEPYEASNGTVIITVTRTGWRSGVEHPVGIYSITASDTRWLPALDSNRHALIGVCTGLIAATLATIAVARRPPWPSLTPEVMVALAQAKAPARHE